MELWSVGHGTLAPEALIGLLRAAGVTRIVDVRTAPGSRRFPWFGRGEMERWLPEAGIAYRWERRLGGFRRPAPDSPNEGLRNASFRGYADHMRTPEFAAALDRVLEEAGREPTAVMCSESLWWRCHRRLIADFATLVRGVAVVHLLHDGRRAPHEPAAGARREGEVLVYPAVPPGAGERKGMRGGGTAR